MTTRRSGALTLLVLLLLAPVLPAHADSAPGVGAWRTPGVSTALQRSGADWFHTWSTRHPGIGGGRAAEFVPTIWGAGSVTPAELSRARRARSPYLMTFNEPDLAEQADLGVGEALRLWPRLERTGKRLLSPSVAYGGADPGGWLDRFLSGAERRGLRVDAVSLHWYGADFDPVRATDQLEAYLRAVHERYGRPLWLTEYALMRFDGGAQQVPSPRVQAAFVRRSTRMLDGLGFVRRHAWFALPAAADGPSTGLFRPGARITPVGRAYRAAAD